MPIGDEMVHHFNVWGFEGLIADNACVSSVKEAHAAKDWRLLPKGPLRAAWEEQEIGANRAKKEEPNAKS